MVVIFARQNTYNTCTAIELGGGGGEEESREKKTTKKLEGLKKSEFREKVKKNEHPCMNYEMQSTGFFRFILLYKAMYLV